MLMKRGRENPKPNETPYDKPNSTMVVSVCFPKFVDDAGYSRVGSVQTRLRKPTLASWLWASRDHARSTNAHGGLLRETLQNKK